MMASFPMYDRPETRPAWDALWDLIRNSDPSLPEHLTWDADGTAHWLRDDLALSQTCSLPYRTRLHGKVALLGAFDFGLPGCPPGYYNSVLVMRVDDARRDAIHWPELTLALNAPDSQSGWAAPFFVARDAGQRFGRRIETGAHHASAIAVAEGRADIAALDAQTHRLLITHEPDLMAQLSEVTRTEPTPGLPLIACHGWDLAEHGPNFDVVTSDIAKPIRDQLSLKSFVPFPTEAYIALPIPPHPRDVLPT